MPAASGLAWWVVQYPVPRTGVQQVTYVQATSRANAANLNPGTTVLLGPFNTEQEAIAAFNQSPEGRAYNQNPHSPSGSGAVGTGPASTVSEAPANPLGFLGAIGHWIGEAVAHLTDAAMWRSVSWILLGVVLIIFGVVLWTKQNLPAGMPIPVPV